MAMQAVVIVPDASKGQLLTIKLDIRIGLGALKWPHYITLANTG